jgi:hypothetical protein
VRNDVYCSPIKKTTIRWVLRTEARLDGTLRASSLIVACDIYFSTASTTYMGFFLSLRNILTCFPFLWRFFELTPAISNDSSIGSGCYFLVCISPQREKSVGVEGYNISQVLQWHLTSLFWLVVSSLSVYFLFRICEIDSLPNLITTSSVSIKISLPHPSSILKP